MSITYVRDEAGCYTRCPPGTPASKATCAPPPPARAPAGGWIIGPPGPPGGPGPPGPPGGGLAFVETDYTLNGDGTMLDPLSCPGVDGGTY